MFRKILLNFFPDSELENKMSPIKFHLKLISPKLFYGLSLKHSLDNRRVVFTDARFCYFVPADLIISDFSKENFFYSYKNYALINGFDNYGLTVLLPSIILIAFVRYFSYLPNNENFENYLKVFLFSINYIMLLFFGHFKEYDEQFSKDERVKFIINLFESIADYLIRLYKIHTQENKINKMVKNLVKILKKDYDFLMFFYKVTEFLAEHFKSLNINHFDYYKYLIPGMLMDFPSQDEFYAIFSNSIKKIFVRRYVVDINPDIISFANLLGGEPIHINYLIGKDNIDYLPYFAESLDHIWDIDISTLEIKDVIDKVLDFKLWGKNLIRSLKDFNSDNIDIVINPDMNFQQVQDLLSKEALSSVKKVSAVNEQFLDFFILLVCKKFTSEGFTYQNPPKVYIKPSGAIKSIEKNIQKHYSFLEKNYFKWSYFYRTKKRIDNPKDFFFHSANLEEKLIVNQAVEILLEDFNKKSLKLYFPTNKYQNLLKTYYLSHIKELLKPSAYKQYLSLLGLGRKRLKFSNKEIHSFKENIYYPDFIVFYDFLKLLKIKLSPEDYINLALIKQTLLGYKIFENIVGRENVINDLYFSAIFSLKMQDYLYGTIVEFDLPDEFISFFTKVKQNREFVNLVVKYVYSLPENHRGWFILDCLRDITLYNKRTFKI